MDREELHFYCDSQSKPAFVEYDGVMYRCVHNPQGDIVAIVDAAGNAVVEYKYDTWGKALSSIGSLVTTLGMMNDENNEKIDIRDAESGNKYDNMLCSCNRNTVRILLFGICSSAEGRNPKIMRIANGRIHR